MAEEEPGYGVGAYADVAPNGKRYIIIGTTTTRLNGAGAQRGAPSVASHELGHALGLGHNQGEFASTNLGTVDPATGLRLIKVCFCAPTGLLREGNAAAHAQWVSQTPSAVPVNNLRNLIQGNDPQKKDMQAIRDGFLAAMKAHQHTLGVKYEVTESPEQADIYIYAAELGRMRAMSSSFATGAATEGTDFSDARSTMPYNRQEQQKGNGFTTWGPDDVYYAQSGYGMPPRDPTRHIIDKARLTEIIYPLGDYDKPMVLKPGAGEGDLTINLLASPTQPVVLGKLKDKPDSAPMTVRQHKVYDRPQYGYTGAIGEVDLAGTNVVADVTGNANAIITLGNKNDKVRLENGGNIVTLGAGADEVTFGSGKNHIIADLTAEDSIKTVGNILANFHSSADTDKGTTITLYEGSSATGSIFARGATLEDVRKKFQGLEIEEEKSNASPVPLHITGETKEIALNCEKKFLVRASELNGRSIGTTDPGKKGNIIVQMTRREINDASWKAIEGTKHCAVTLTAADQKPYSNFNLQNKVLIQLVDDAGNAVGDPQAILDKTGTIIGIKKTAEVTKPSAPPSTPQVGHAPLKEAVKQAGAELMDSGVTIQAASADHAHRVWNGEIRAERVLGFKSSL